MGAKGLLDIGTLLVYTGNQLSKGSVQTSFAVHVFVGEVVFMIDWCEIYVILTLYIHVLHNWLDCCEAVLEGDNTLILNEKLAYFWFKSNYLLGCNILTKLKFIQQRHW